MSNKPCKKCPWVVNTELNNRMVEYSKKHNKPHNCHMIPSDKRGGLWDCKEQTKCVGRTLYENKNE